MRLTSIALLCLLTVPVAALADYPGDTRHVVIVTLDGVRYEKVNSWIMPNLFYTWRDSSTFYSDVLNLSCTFTGPAHASLITGAWCWDQQTSVGSKSRIRVPTIGDMVRAQYADTCAVASNKKGISSSWQYSVFPDSAMGWYNLADYYTSTNTTWDGLLADSAWAHMQATGPRFTLINLGGVDELGHTFYDSSAIDGYMRAYDLRVRNCDQFVQDLWDAIQVTEHWADSTTVIVTTDHGRHSPYYHAGGQSIADADTCHRHHGCHCLGCSRCWAWIRGPDTHRDSIYTHPVYQIDLAATAAHMLGVWYPTIEGRVLRESFASFAEADTTAHSEAGGTFIDRGKYRPSVAVGDSFYLAAGDTAGGIYLTAKPLSGGTWRAWTELFATTADVDTGTVLWADFEDGTAGNWHVYDTNTPVLRIAVEAGIDTVGITDSLWVAYNSTRACTAYVNTTVGSPSRGKQCSAGIYRAGLSATDFVLSFDACIDTMSQAATSFTLADIADSANAQIFAPAGSSGLGLAVQHASATSNDSLLVFARQATPSHRSDSVMIYVHEWHRYALRYKIDGSAGIASVWLDGARLSHRTGIDTDENSPDAVGIGALMVGPTNTANQVVGVCIDNAALGTVNPGPSLVYQIPGPPKVVIVNNDEPLVFWPVLVDSTEGNDAIGALFWGLEQRYRSGGSWSDAKRSFLSSGHAMNWAYDAWAYNDGSVFVAAAIDTNLLQPACGSGVLRYMKLVLKRSHDRGNTWRTVWMLDRYGHITDVQIVAQGEEIVVAWIENVSCREVFARTSTNRGQNWGPVANLTTSTGLWTRHEMMPAIGLKP